VIPFSLLLILLAVTLLVLGLTGGSSLLLISSIAASLLAAVALVIGARQAAAGRRRAAGVPLRPAPASYGPVTDPYGPDPASFAPDHTDAPPSPAASGVPPTPEDDPFFRDAPGVDEFAGDPPPFIRKGRHTDEHSDFSGSDPDGTPQDPADASGAFDPHRSDAHRLTDPDFGRADTARVTEPDNGRSDAHRVTDPDYDRSDAHRVTDPGYDRSDADPPASPDRADDHPASEPDYSRAASFIGAARSPEDEDESWRRSESAGRDESRRGPDAPPPSGSHAASSPLSHAASAASSPSSGAGRASSPSSGAGRASSLSSGAGHASSPSSETDPSTDGALSDAGARSSEFFADQAGASPPPPEELAEPDEDDPADEPYPQAVRPGDAVRVARMDAEVLVVDGRPRYHVAECTHLVGRLTEPLPVNEAVELGFSPCGLCRPVDRLVAQAAHR
jgi:clumping factor A